MNPNSAKALATVADRLDALTRGVGRVVAYFMVATVMICFVTVYLRYALGIGFVWLQESYVWTHVAAIMFGSSFAMLQGGFVRVDMLYNKMTVRGKAWVDLIGTIAFMAPFLWMAAVSGWSFFLSSWRMNERSAYESGLPAIYLLKGTILIFVVLVGIQGIAIVCRNILILLGHAPPTKSSGSAQPVVSEV